MAARRERVTFTGGTGEELAGKVELPAGRVRATAVFAHCFTCSSDSAAAARVSQALAEAGIAVMRFDFTGLGASEGEFADTNFSTNVADLVAASAYLERTYDAPGILVGHSLGGAAVLAAAPRLPAIRAVVTIGAPAEPSHVERLLSGGVAALESDGEARVDIGGRPFVLRRQLLDDLRATTLEQCLSGLGAALLVMHSPVDAIVGVDNAQRIYEGARHPKSFVSLDGADHLLTDRRDAAFAASMIRPWLERFLDPEPAPLEGSDMGVVVAETREGRFLNQVVAGPHRFCMDEAESVGGYDAGPDPYQLLAAALGGCTSMTMRMYADRKGIALERAEVEVRHSKTHASDCEDTVGGSTPKIDRWERRLTLTGDLSADDRASLRKIADRCPVHLTLERSSQVVTEVVPGVVGAP